jgi:FAD/FMN-containing dehydrogenase
VIRDDLLAWGKVHRFKQRLRSVHFQDEARPLVCDSESGMLLARGMGRSYGDSGLNADGTLIDMTGLDRFIEFDYESGVLNCESGVILGEILRMLESRPMKGGGWFLPVSPGTKFVTVGGAIANDVHGKNHHRTGCFGNHVLSLRLLRSTGDVLTCSQETNGDLFRATIGGLGLTGLILSARLALNRVPSFMLDAEDIRYDNLEEFYAISDQSLAEWEYSVAWVDCFAKGSAVGRGVFSRARHAANAPPASRRASFEPRLNVRWDLPEFVLNRFSIGLFNSLRWWTATERPRRQQVHYERVLYPLDAIGAWNRIYGMRGFYQFQCVVPTAARAVIHEMLVTIQEAGQGSFLGVLKTFGDVVSPGLLSFPIPGVTLALDFPNRGATTHSLLRTLEGLATSVGGRTYPAKDGHISAAAFQRGYPEWQRFSAFSDPKFSSSFWRRVSRPCDDRDHSVGRPV